MKKRFQKRIENFTCEECGKRVTGTGYTDHCPQCLWSKHVDVYPGDREASCGGALEPVGISKHGEGHSIRYRCRRCGAEKVNRAAPEDNFERLLYLSSHQ